MSPYKKRTSKPYLFLVIDTTLTSDNPLCFRKNIFEKIKKVIKTINNKIRNEKLQYDINREVAKISALSRVNLINMNILWTYYILVKIR